MSYTLSFYTKRAFANVPMAAAGAMFGHTARRQAAGPSPIDPAHAQHKGRLMCTVHSHFCSRAPGVLFFDADVGCATWTAVTDG
jgi:hypothetical protein